MNQIFVIRPYRKHGTWVFDEPLLGLFQEPFVAGIPEMIDIMVKNIPDAQSGFRLTFSSGNFPSSTHSFELVSQEFGGSWYRMAGTEKLGWLCPALFKFFDSSPAVLYSCAEQL